MAVKKKRERIVSATHGGVTTHILQRQLSSGQWMNWRLVAGPARARRTSATRGKRRGPPKGKTPPHLKKYLFKKGHR